MNLPPRPNQLVCWHVEPFDNHLNRLLQEAVGARHLAQSQDPVGRAWRRKSFWSSDGRRPTCRASQIKMKSSDWRLNQNKHAWRSQEQPPHCPGSHSVTGTASHPPCWFSTTPRKSPQQDASSGPPRGIPRPNQPNRPPQPAGGGTNKLPVALSRQPPCQDHSSESRGFQSARLRRLAVGKSHWTHVFKSLLAFSSKGTTWHF